MTVKVVQPCSTARLLAEVLDVPLEVTYEAAGLELCPVCDTASKNPETYPYCSKGHRQQDNLYTPLICDWCGGEFQRRTKLVLWNLGKRGYEQVFCSRTCLGKSAGRNYGFVAHPENAELGKGRRLGQIQTHCKRGHALTPENRYQWGPRPCKLCFNWRKQESRALKSGRAMLISNKGVEP